jgi:hypothetical protein
MTYMGSYISIGLTYGIEKFEDLVYDNPTLDRVIQELRNLIEYFMNHNGAIKEIKYSEDIDGENWIEINPSSFFSCRNCYKNFCSGYFGEIILHSDVLISKGLDCIVRLYKENDFFGFLLDLQEEDILISKSYSIEEIDYMTKELISIMINLYSYSKYDYAFCDHEANFKHSPQNIEIIKEYVYSIVIIPRFDNNFTIIKSDWNIDGHTAREKHGRKIIYRKNIGN